MNHPLEQQTLVLSWHLVLPGGSKRERDISISLQERREDHGQWRAQYSLFIPKGLLIAEHPAKASGQKSSSESSGVCKDQVLKLLSGDKKSSY